MERVLSGLADFDRLVNGGIPRRNVVLLSGGSSLRRRYSASNPSTKG